MWDYRAALSAARQSTITTAVIRIDANGWLPAADFEGCFRRLLIWLHGGGEPGMEGEQWRCYDRDVIRDEWDDVRSVQGFDQLRQVVQQLESGQRPAPVTTYNPVDADAFGTSRYLMWQASTGEGRLNLLVTISHADAVAELPNDIATFTLLLHMLASVTGDGAGNLDLVIAELGGVSRPAYCGKISISVDAPPSGLAGLLRIRWADVRIVGNGSGTG